jgi:hypothetical protein
MRKVLLFAVCVLAASAGRATAQGDPKAVIEKAIQAHGGAEKLEKYKAVHTKGKGTLELFNMQIEFTTEAHAQRPDKFKSVMEMNLGGMKISMTQMYNGEKFSINQNGMEVPLNDAMKNEVKEQVYAERIGDLLFLNDKDIKLSALPEIQVNGKPAVGVKVSSAGHRDINLYFDKQSGLLVKTEGKTLDAMTMQEINQEKFYSDYKDFDGIKRPTKVVVNRDGKKFMEVEVTELKNLEKLDDSVFQS